MVSMYRFPHNRKPFKRFRILLDATCVEIEGLGRLEKPSERGCRYISRVSVVPSACLSSPWYEVQRLSRPIVLSSWGADFPSVSMTLGAA